MLDELADDLATTGQQLVIAHDLGQVGDLLAHGGTTTAPCAVYPTIDDAVAAVTADGRESAGPGS